MRVLLADENKATLDDLASLLRSLEHEPTPFAISPAEAAQVIAEDDPDLALVRLHHDDEHALALIGEIAEYASGPVIALLDAEDVGFVAAAAERGISAYVQPVTAGNLQGAIEVARRRHADAERLSEKVDQLETALERRAIIERAKGILMERHGIDERAAFELLRTHARGSNRTVVDVARAVASGHALLPPSAR
ncbi:MAG TPA: ANTAR domain-containing protein [Solirubrobacteraceae bacterium]|nr:ANTAR domain-containing protein [Solirubrobacteraceae bacterium]